MKNIFSQKKKEENNKLNRNRKKKWKWLLYPSPPNDPKSLFLDHPRGPTPHPSNLYSSFAKLNINMNVFKITFFFCLRNKHYKITKKDFSFEKIFSIHTKHILSLKKIIKYNETVQNYICMKEEGSRDYTIKEILGYIASCYSHKILQVQSPKDDFYLLI